MNYPPFSKLKKVINGLFEEKLKMDFCCIAYPMRAAWANNHTPRFYVRLGKEIIWDYPKNIASEHFPMESWAYRDNNGICELVRDYIDTPVSELLTKKFDRDTWTYPYAGSINARHQEDFDFNYKLTEVFIAADRRLGRDALLKWAEKKQNPIVDKILTKRFA